MVEKIKKENLIKIPDMILERVGLHRGDYVEVSDDGYKIIITPKVENETFSDDEFDKLERLILDNKKRSFSSGKTLLKHLDDISKK